ncbi:1-phosphofructokinase [Ruminococcus sp. YE71]|uniref:1-phosphofructokinase n=1 Tax=unclassified Ruminococcus TaxID=2608920 RepID=UPI0008923A38|nr:MULTISPECIES: 1-phosphofructokinase [unclassified Ruminococcus]SDA13767.1 1-phosphofructokinase [Ruminococcus sp. YE78]SFW19658.1 1-phosphofructokinase [Ruminococcus sp. YE71]
MIYTVTFNPAIDYVVHTDAFTLGETNRSKGENMFFGGKGINVSAVLKELGLPSVALGFVAGFTGEAIGRGLEEMGLDTDFVRLASGNSRINVKIKADSETELNGQGPDISAEALDELFAKLGRLTDGDTLILAGSVPPSLPADIYERILAKLSDRKVRTAVDASGKLLLNVLKYKPFLVKPNLAELGDMFGLKLTNADEAEVFAKKLREMGAVNVLVSMAGDGALLIDEYGASHRCGVCKGTVRNSVGAGDSMVAGFMAGVLSQENRDEAMTVDYGYALRLGTAAGGATAFSDGLADKKTIEQMLGQLSERGRT